RVAGVVISGAFMVLASLDYPSPKTGRDSSPLALIVIVHLEQHAPGLGLERAVVDARRPARIGGRLKRLAALALRVVADDEGTRHQIPLLPMVVNEGGGGVHAGLEPQQARPAPHFSGLVEIACENLLLDAGRIASRRVPALVHVDGVKFEMRLVHWHDDSPSSN